MLRRSRSFFRLALVVVFLLGLVAYILEVTLRPTMEAVIRHTVQIRATEAINRAVLERVAGTVSYSDLYIVRENADGLVSFVQPNTPKINRIAAQVVLTVQQELKRMEDEYFGINLSQIVGSRLFATRGPALKVGMESIGTVKVNVESRFDQAGFNQTRHIVFLRIRVEVQAITPTFITVFPVEEVVPLAEGIIVGPVPGSGLFDFRIDQPREAPPLDTFDAVPPPEGTGRIR